MLRLKDKDGLVTVIDCVLGRSGPRTFSNAAERRDNAGNLDIDKQWSRVQYVYQIRVDRQIRDAIWLLWKKTCPVITTSGSTPAFTACDEEVFGRSWIACTFTGPEIDFGQRAGGTQELYALTFALEYSASTFDTTRRTL
jgi:hypothetical protein